MTALELARFFHDTYERLAPDFGYETRQDTREFSPASKNGQLMVAVCAEVLTRLGAWSAAPEIDDIKARLAEAEAWIAGARHHDGCKVVRGDETCTCGRAAILAPYSAASQPTAARPLSEWHEDDGPVLWWVFPVTEPPYCGTPIDAEWPCYHTHWTRIEVPRAVRGKR